MTKPTCSIENCAKPMVARGWCNVHYMHWRRKGDPSYTPQTADQRFWSKVDKSGECWLWIASKDGMGYGTVGIDGRVHRAHRVSYEAAAGPIPAGRQIDHICHTPACVRPDHLRLATHKQNRENLVGSYANSKSGVRGVYWNKRNRKWQGQVGHNGKQYHVGLFEDMREAEAAVIARRNELFTHNHLDRVA